MDEDFENYNILLRPVRDALIKDWEKALKPYLEGYLHHLNVGSTNFSEAALILQNSTKFYCKRVEILYGDVLDFILYMNNAGARGENSGSGLKKGRRGAAKSFHDDDLEVLGLVSGGSDTNFKSEKIRNIVTENGNVTVKKSVILNPLVKVPIKTGSACQMYQQEGVEIGNQDEFRLFWSLTCGALSEDCNTNQDQCFSMINDPILDEAGNNSGNISCITDNPCDDHNYDDDHMDIDGGPSGPPSIDQPLPDINPSSPSCYDPPGDRIIANDRNKDPWKTISYDVSFPVRKLKVRNVLKMAPGVEEVENQAKRKKCSSYIECIWDMSHLFYQTVLLDSTDALTFKCNLAEKNRRSMLLKRKTVTNECEEDEDDNYYVADDNLQDDEDSSIPFDDVILEPEEVDFNHSDPKGVSYIEEAKKCQEQLRSAKRIYASRAAEIAKRVSDWHRAIASAIEESEARSAFNVHEYGTKIINEFNDTDSQLSFKTLVKNKSRDEICKTFLASLMLANTSNIELSKRDNKELAKDCLQLKLISKVRHEDLLNENIGATTSAAI